MAARWHTQLDTLSCGLAISLIGQSYTGTIISLPLCHGNNPGKYEQIITRHNGELLKTPKQITTRQPLYACVIWCIVRQRALFWDGVTKAPFVNFSMSQIFDLPKVRFKFFNHIHIWPGSPQLSGWTWYSISSVCFDNAENIGKWRDGGYWLSKPHPGWC